MAKDINIYEFLNTLFDNFRGENGNGNDDVPIAPDKKVNISLEGNTIGEATIVPLETVIGKLATFQGKVGLLIPKDDSEPEPFTFKVLCEKPENTEPK